MKNIEKRESARKKLANSEQHVKERKFKFKNDVNIGRWNVDKKFLEDYVKKVDYLRRATKIGVSCNDPLIILKALQQREDIHRKIFQSVGLPYHADKNSTDESLEFNIALDKLVTSEIRDINE